MLTVDCDFADHGPEADGLQPACARAGHHWHELLASLRDFERLAVRVAHHRAEIESLGVAPDLLPPWAQRQLRAVDAAQAALAN